MYYHGVDLVKVVGGDGPPPKLVLELIAGLPDKSLLHAEILGGREKRQEYHGWGRDRELAASLYDLLALNTRASGNWGKKKPPKINPFPRPWDENKKHKSQAVKARTLDDLHSAFMRWQGG